MARVVTIHLVIPDDKLHVEPGKRMDGSVIPAQERLEASLSDYVSGMLTHTLEVQGKILDWGYAEGGFPDRARFVDESNYEEGDFYCRSGLRPYLPGVLVKEWPCKPHR